MLIFYRAIFRQYVDLLHDVWCTSIRSYDKSAAFLARDLTNDPEVRAPAIARTRSLG